MHKLLSFFLILFLAVLVFPLAAQDYEGEEEDNMEPYSPPVEIDTDWDSYTSDLYTQGDKTFNISLGMIFPTVFTGEGLNGRPHNISFGGIGSLSYNYFFNSHFFIGGEVSGMFAGTGGENMVYIIPFGIRGGYQFLVNRFEIPITVMVGGAPQKYVEEAYFGLVVKAGASGFFRFNNDWSFGLNAQWWMLPQWTKDSKDDVFGNFLEITLSARYHF